MVPWFRLAAAVLCVLGSLFYAMPSVNSGRRRQHVPWRARAASSLASDFDAVLERASILHPAQESAQAFDAVQQSRAHLKSLGITIKEKADWFVGICGATKGSGNWLREWIEFHIVSGVDHVWLVNDNDDETEDGTAAMMAFYEALGFLTIIPGRMPVSHPGCRRAASAVGRVTLPDCAAPKYCAERVREQVKWLIFADTDEFAFPRAGCSLSEYVRSTCDQDEASITVRWERFGTGVFDNQQPAGLMAENFLSSGGDCSDLPARYAQSPVQCQRSPYTSCPECRHMKQLVNTHCATTDHVGWIHYLTNTTDWKAQFGKGFENSPGTETLPFKHAACKFSEDRRIARRCLTWLHSPAAAEQRYTPACCAAGIGYNHYGTKAAKHYWRKQARAASDVRGWRTDLLQVDLNAFLSPSILRFVRAVRQRLIAAGSPVSVATHFLDVEYRRPSAANATAKKGTCFQEFGYRYRPAGSTGPGGNASTDTTEVPVPNGAAPGEFCCAACWAAAGGGCVAWTAAEGVCRLLFPSPRAVHSGFAMPHVRPIPQLVRAERVVDPRAYSGSRVVDECHVLKK
ncbi:hypothetical protein DIPPA_29699 [Diplonema papillatum]|nr:hypothetical protein DIPPA_29699 [Diplonema papillatum]